MGIEKTNGLSPASLFKTPNTNAQNMEKISKYLIPSATFAAGYLVAKESYKIMNQQLADHYRLLNQRVNSTCQTNLSSEQFKRLTNNDAWKRMVEENALSYRELAKKVGNGAAIGAPLGAILSIISFSYLLRFALSDLGIKNAEVVNGGIGKGSILFSLAIPSIMLGGFTTQFAEPTSLDYFGAICQKARQIGWAKKAAKSISLESAYAQYKVGEYQPLGQPVFAPIPCGSASLMAPSLFLIGAPALAW